MVAVSVVSAVHRNELKVNQRGVCVVLHEILEKKIPGARTEKKIRRAESEI